MSAYAAFLRGMNLGRRRITNAELREHFERLGFDSVGTFRASGNVVFEHGNGVGAGAEQRRCELQERIEGGLAGALGYPVPTFVRSAGELREIASFEPFEAERVRRSAGKLQVSLLARSPSDRERAKVLSLATGEDALAFGRRELYWLPSGGISDSELDTDAVTGLLGSSTMRTVGTIEAIVRRFLAPGK
jgi:uncharacterized protein (DUF1697 family)